METKDTSGAIALSLLIVGAIGAIVYLFLRKKKGGTDVAAAAKTAPINQSVAAKINAGFSTDMSKSSDDQIKQYATWLDKIEEIVNKMKAGSIKAATPELIYNTRTIMNLGDDSLRKTVQRWESIRNRKISTHAAFNNQGSFYDDSETVPGLLSRLIELNLIG
ncbi:hypothetical protein [Pedobacter jeongneungensis]|uniref:hypothetical protein n=1 Tax=Pedobacter jeongneungensis TaxID=947309 RepID=UPI000468DD10|nr:hypothetical protein [Pedobacter jeongneungensis]